MMNHPDWATKRGLKGPWPCDECGELSQYGDVRKHLNIIFCRNESCDFKRVIDKRNQRVIENDGTVWEYDGNGAKRQVRARI